jgi:hypothetical protein
MKINAIMILYRKTSRSLVIRNVSNHDAREQKANNKLHQKASRKGSVDKLFRHYVNDVT